MATKKKQNTRIVESGNIYITSTFNNTLITISDEGGKTLIVGSSGMHGFTGARKSTPYAASVTTESVIKRAMLEYGMRKATVFVKGIGPGREASLRTIKGSSLEVDVIMDITPVPHNGVMPPKIRRV